jgi:hypothetical protein
MRQTILEHVAVAAFTASSEMLQEHRLAIKHFLKFTYDTLPRSTKAKLKACLTVTELASTGWRKLMSLLKRSDPLSRMFKRLPRQRHWRHRGPRKLLPGTRNSGRLCSGIVPRRASERER